jgi:NAD(P)-dependent dehydrogenase (short-subunit alcohol dehydrogenase family)
MARVFVTGSAQGIGLAAAGLLLDDGHEVVLHARDDQRAGDVRRAEPRAAAVLVGDLSSIGEVRELGEQADKTGRFDAVVHNAGIAYEPRRHETPDGLERTFAVNVLAPYLLTATMARPSRLVYLSSGAHQSGVTTLDDPQWTTRRFNGSQAYSDTKLLDLVLAFAVARRWPEVKSNAVDPGWVATRMGGSGAPGTSAEGADTPVWLATSDDPAATVTGGYFYHRRERSPVPATKRAGLQDALLAYCAELTGTPLPAATV